MNLEAYIKYSQEQLATGTMDFDDEKVQLFNSIKKRLFKQIDFTALSYDERVDKVRTSTWLIIEDLLNTDYKNIILSTSEKADMLENILQVMFGYGVIEPFIDDEDVTEIMINGTEFIFYEMKGQLHVLTDGKGQKLNYRNNEEIMHVIDKIVSPINRKVDQSNPIVDARLPNGSRVNIVIPPASMDGPVVTIRKFPKNPFTIEDLIRFGSLTRETANFLKMLVVARYNIIVAGGTGSGKTTFLNALSSYIPNSQRVITVEDSAELKITQVDNLIRMEARPANVEGKGEIAIRDLVKSALRMRPDRIVVGEVRSGEALDMLQAMNTGHDGSLTTGHANSPVDMISRIETMILMTGFELPVAAIRKQIASAVDIIIFIRKMHDGSRKVDEIVELGAVENNEIIVHSLGKQIKKGDKFVFQLMKNKLINREKIIYSGLKEEDYEIY